MKILLIGPHHPGGSHPPYLDVLADALRGHGAQVDRLGAPGLPYDVEQGRLWDADAIIGAADALLEQHDLTDYDLLSVHFGNLEIEQLLPARWPARRPPAVYHIHSLDWTLFDRHVPSPALRRAVAEGVAAVDGYVAFGSYCLAALQLVCNPHAPAPGPPRGNGFGSESLRSRFLSWADTSS